MEWKECVIDLNVLVLFICTQSRCLQAGAECARIHNGSASGIEVPNDVVSFSSCIFDVVWFYWRCDLKWWRARGTLWSNSILLWAAGLQHTRQTINLWFVTKPPTAENWYRIKWFALDIDLVEVVVCWWAFSLSLTCGILFLRDLIQFSFFVISLWEMDVDEILMMLEVY